MQLISHRHMLATYQKDQTVTFQTCREVKLGLRNLKINNIIKNYNVAFQHSTDFYTISNLCQR